VPNAAYGPSKAAVHWLTKAMDREEEKIAAFALNPGLCQTDMGNSGARFLGLEEAPVPVVESCTGMVRVIDGASKKSHGGKLWSYEGETLSW
jgi:norsolorinic acid ketoreductase